MTMCNEIRQRSVAYFASELTDTENQQVEQHLAACGQCRRQFSEAYSGFRLAEAAFNAPDADRGLNAARLGAIYAVAAGGTAPRLPAGRADTVRRAWFAAAACAVVAAAAWVSQPMSGLSAIDAPQVAAAADSVPAPPSAPAILARQAVHAYPPSYGLIYPTNYRAAGGYTPDDQYATVMIDYDSVPDHSLFVYDPAYGMGRTVITDASRVKVIPNLVEYGLGTTTGQLRL